MEKFLEKAFRISLSLFLSVVITYSFLAVLITVRPSPDSSPVSDASIIAGFIQNGDSFEAVQKYITAQDKEISLSSENYAEIVQEKEVSDALRNIFTMLGCKKVEKNEDTYITFVYDSGNRWSKGIQYSSKDFFICSAYDGHCEELSKHWYFYNSDSRLFQSYFYRRIEEIGIAFVCIFVLTACTYLLLGKVPFFKKEND